MNLLERILRALLNLIGFGQNPPQATVQPVSFRSPGRIGSPNDPTTLTPVQTTIALTAISFDVDPPLALAHAEVESNFNPKAENPADPSFGVMQILCGNNGRNSICTNRLPAIPEFSTMTPNKLMELETNVRIGVQIIAANLSYFGDDQMRAIIAYNNWSAAVKGPPYPPIATNYYARVKSALNRFEKL